MLGYLMITGRVSYRGVLAVFPGRRLTKFLFKKYANMLDQFESQGL